RPCHFMLFWLGYSTLVRSSFAGSSGLGPGSAVLEGLYRSAVDMITSARTTGMILDIFTASSRCLRPRMNECAVQHIFYSRVRIDRPCSHPGHDPFQLPVIQQAAVHLIEKPLLEHLGKDGTVFFLGKPVNDSGSRKKIPMRLKLVHQLLYPVATAGLGLQDLR